MLDCQLFLPDPKEEPVRCADYQTNDPLHQQQLQQMQCYIVAIMGLLAVIIEDLWLKLIKGKVQVASVAHESEQKRQVKM